MSNLHAVNNRKRQNAQHLTGQNTCQKTYEPLATKTSDIFGTLE